MSIARKILMGSAGGKKSTYVDDVFSTYLYRGSSGSGSVGGVVLGTRYRLTIYQPVTITIYAVSTATSDINITMTSSQGAITITPNSVTIPANQNSTNFAVTAQQEGPINVTVKARSHGYHDTILEFYGVR